ncbi:MAG TPA: polysaccharide biosynthesis tyrosine autokinase [Gemmatimonadaceae bacterium]
MPVHGPTGSAEVEGWELVRRYLAAVLRYKWLLVLMLVAGGGASVATTRFVRPTYEVQATIWLATQTPEGRAAGPFRAHELVNVSAWPDLLTSYVILDSVVLKTRLFVRPTSPVDAPLFRDFELAARNRPGEYRLTVSGAAHKYVLTAKDGSVVERGAVGDSIGRSAGFRWAPELDAKDRVVKFTVFTPRAASLLLRQRLSTTLPPNDNLLRVQLDGTDPAEITLTMNTLLQQFVATAATLKNHNLIELAKTLDQQLEYAQSQLRDAEIALESFRVNTITLPSEGGPVASGVQLTRDPVLTSYFAQKIEYDNIVHDRELIEQMLTQFKTGALDVSSLWFVNAVQNGPPELRNSLTEYATKSSALRAARQVFTDEHRAVRELDAATRALRDQTVPQLASSLVAQLRERETALGDRINAAARELRQIPTRTIEEMRLTRNVSVRENLYTTLKNRYEEARLASASAIPDVSILDQAVVPQLPRRNTARAIIALGTFASLGLAVLLAIVLDRFDTRFRYPDQIARELGLDVLGAVPAMDRRIKSIYGAAEVIESFRSIRLSLANAFSETQTAMVTVTSPGPGDGKSIVCANLALSFASAGYRTLLIDGDIRRGDLHTTLGVGRTPGLTDVLLDAVSAPDAVRATETPRLWILPSGTRQRTGPELLTSQQLPQCIAQLQSRFDVLIVDTPPLGAGVDAYALATATRNMVLVVRAGVTSRKLASAKLRMLDRLPVRVLGAVLNGIESNRLYEHYSYLPGYVVESDDSRALVKTNGRVRVV